jgi:hypothetical protein
MTRARKVLLTIGSLLAMLLVFAAWTRFRAPELAAKEDTYAVWIALLKGFEGDVLYVGSDDTHAYFRMGYMFWSYYKVPACVAKLPRTFALGTAPYVVRSQNVPNYSTECVSNSTGLGPNNSFKPNPLRGSA